MNRSERYLSETDEDIVIGMLIEGFGVEDIAVRLKRKVAHVRGFVFGLAPDVLREIYRRD